MTELKPWLCVDDKCIYADVSYQWENKPLFARSKYTHRVKAISVYCNYKHRFIRKYTTSCKHYQNRTL